MKKLLLLILFFTTLTNAQNSISIVSVPTEISQGATFDLVFEYTSATAGMYEIQLMPLDANGQPVWSMSNAFYASEAISTNATAKQVTVNVSVPNDITLTADLETPAVAWGIFGKLTDGSSDTAYLSPYPEINVVSASTNQEPTSISIVDIPTEVVQGATFNVTFEYTSTTTGMYELQFIPMNAEGQPVWSISNAFYASEAISVNASATQVTVPVTIPGDIALTADLESPAVAWGLFGKLTDGTADTAYLSPYPLINVVAGTNEPSAGTISIVSFPAEVAKGSTINVVFEYTSNFVGTYELQFIPMNAEGQPVWGQDKAFASDAIGINATATQLTVPLTIPEDITLSANLTSPAVAWGLFGKLADAKGDVAYLSPYPQTNVVATLGIRNNVFDANTIYYNAGQKTLEVNAKNINAASLNIYDITGKNVMTIKDAKIQSSINVSSLSSGMYIVRSKSKFFKFVK